ncbi:MAG: hypothetical protein KA214_06540, partial [Neisseriaceae bacterium]|nr:hypothetical protein [Neisseriaceae bacterium]
GQGGRALLQLSEPHGYFTVKWGPHSAHQCRFDFDLAAQAPTTGPEKHTLTCQPEGKPK